MKWRGPHPYGTLHPTHAHTPKHRVISIGSRAYCPDQIWIAYSPCPDKGKAWIIWDKSDQSRAVGRKKATNPRTGKKAQIW
jgi:hypothetical protein